MARAASFARPQVPGSSFEGGARQNGGYIKFAVVEITAKLVRNRPESTKLAVISIGETRE